MENKVTKVSTQKLVLSANATLKVNIKALVADYKLANYPKEKNVEITERNGTTERSENNQRNEVNRANENKTIDSNQINKIVKHYKVKELYSFNDRNNQLQVLIGADGKKNFMMGNNDNPILCDWCRTKLSETWIGIPTKRVINDGNILYFTEDFFDTFECAYAAIKEYYIKNVNKYHQAEMYLKSLFYKLYPNSVFKPAPNYRLLAPRGTMTKEEFTYDSHTYKIIPHTEFIPSTILALKS